MRELKQAITELQEIKLEEKFAKKRLLLIGKLNEYLCQRDFPYRESFYIKQAANEIKTTINAVQRELGEEEGKAFMLILTQHWNQLTRWDDDCFQQARAFEALDQLRGSLSSYDQKISEAGDQKTKQPLTQRKIYDVWTKLLVNPSGDLFSEDKNEMVLHSDYSLTERCFNLGILFTQYTTDQIEHNKHEHSFSLFLWLLLASQKNWIQNAPLFGIYLFQNDSENPCISMGKRLQFLLAPRDDGFYHHQLKMQVEKFLREKNIYLKDITDEQVCELFNLIKLESVDPKNFSAELEQNMPKVCANIVIEFYGKAIRLFKPCVTPREEILQLSRCVIS